MANPTPQIPPPQRGIPLGDHRRIHIGAQLGRGSVATVYRAVEGPFGVARPVALKVFDVLSTDEQDVVFRAIGQAVRDAACVQHPNVVAVYELGVAGPAQPFIASELVEGRSLAAVLDSCAVNGKRVPLDLALYVGIEMAEAIAGARLARTADGARLSIVHGELSASDVLLSWHGEVKVTDFGLGAASRASSSVRSMKHLARRIRALAPEVARGQFGDARSDVFSLGVILRELLVGPRFPAQMSESEIIRAAREGVVHSAACEPQLPTDLRELLARALDRDPGRRFSHAGALAYDLRRVALSMGVGDGRSFLRHAMPKLLAAEGRDELEDTDEVPSARASGVCVSQVNRFARFRRPAPESARVLRAALRAEAGANLLVFDDEED